MSENIRAIRREGQKHECLVAQTEGKTQKYHFVRSAWCETLARILEDPEMRRALVHIITHEPKLRLVHNEPSQ